MTLSINDIHETIRGLQIEGRREEELEALLIHEDDYIKLLKSLDNQDGMSSMYHYLDSSSPEIKICGVKIITSSYIQPGSIFKIFKKDKPYKYPFNQGKMWQLEYPMMIPENGFLPPPISTITDREEKEKKHSLARKIELD